MSFRTLLRTAFRTARSVAALAIPILLAQSAHAVVGTVQDHTGAWAIAYPGQPLVVDFRDGAAEGFAFPARAFVATATAIEQVNTTCRLLAASIECQAVGSASLFPIGTDVFAVDVKQMGPSLVALVFPGDVSVEAVVFNWLKLECELELDDFDECDRACEARGYPGSEAIAQQSGIGCSLACRCYTADGAVAGVFEEIDD